ncbi:SIMPL domain-containing protein [Brevundimonas denitrificans]|uniref:SIMPL domain-containing protein n=1 Tax=Brevundimonas denitrificans TaxID=1443434 RepID=A0ABQ6BF78_9CAUL|nr:SIMPL domain-containing protein [Brevundimonas denitrificans]GLS00685.1 SIMPL domain-containing protein [Brevundimonas denitrificans]
MTRNTRAMMLGGALMAAVALGAPAAMAQSQPAGGAPMMIHAMAERPALNLSAYGEVKIAPDMATISFGVVTEATTAAEAMSLNAARMNQVMAALRRAGIEARDVQTSGLNLSAQYDYVQNEPPRLRGYQASNQVTVIINDLTKVGTTADAVVAAGVNQINGIGFGLKDPTAAENQARQIAVRNLQAKAALYAQALGVELGGIRSLSEGGGYSPPQPMLQYARAEMAMDAGSTPVAAGQLTVRIDITGVYDLNR